MTLRVYLAGTYARKDELRAYAAELEDPDGIVVSSSWLGGDHEYADAAKQHTASIQTRRGWAETNQNEILSSDLFVLFTDAEPIGSGGHHWEAGFANAHRITTIICGPRQNVFYCLGHPGHVTNWIDAKQLINLFRSVRERQDEHRDTRGRPGNDIEGTG